MMQLNRTFTRWIFFWIVLCILIVWLPSEVIPQVAVVLGGANLIVLVITHPRLLKKPASLMIRVLGSTVVVYGVSGTILESLCQIRSLSGFSVLPLSEICHSSDPFIYGSIILAFASLVGSIACGAILLAFIQRRQ